MIEFSNFSKIVDRNCVLTVKEFLSDKNEIKTTTLQKDYVLDDVSGPSIEVKGDKVHYSCILEYRSDQGLLFLEMLSDKFQFLNMNEAPDLDILDLLGEFLNILCGKINKDIEDVESDLKIEIPYFEYGLDVQGDESLGAIECFFGDLSFKLHYILS